MRRFAAVEIEADYDALEACAQGRRAAARRGLHPHVHVDAERSPATTRCLTIAA
ncbi:MAG: hypothetical protein WDN04_13710 [Rhodospirillales bacterium]